MWNWVHRIWRISYNCSCAWYSDISTIPHLAKYRLIIVIEKKSPKISRYNFFQYRTQITQLSPFTHQPWLFHHTCTSFTHTHISSSLPCTHRKVLFCPGWHSERFPCFLIPCVYLDCLFTLTVCCLPFWPCLPVDIFSVCCLPRPLHCPCCWFCLAFIIPVTAFDPCLFDLLSEKNLLDYIKKSIKKKITFFKIFIFLFLSFPC